MSSSLMWEPGNREGDSLSTALKAHMVKRHGTPLDITIGVEDELECGFLHGLAYCGVEDAEKLLELIERHGSVRLWLEY